MDREARKGQNEAWFRELNERLEHRALAKRPIGETFEIVCECDREDCTERISISFDQYEDVRASATTFIVAPGHTDPEVEDVVRRAGTYEVIDKSGEAALVAVEENPRA